jgi:hypothetical protein
MTPDYEGLLIRLALLRDVLVGLPLYDEHITAVELAEAAIRRILTTPQNITQPPDAKTRLSN